MKSKPEPSLKTRRTLLIKNIEEVNKMNIGTTKYLSFLEYQLYNIEEEIKAEEERIKIIDNKKGLLNALNKL